MMRNFPIILDLLTLPLAVPAAGIALQHPCPATPPDAEGPFYRTGAKVPNKIGKGYLLLGEVKSAADCAPVAGLITQHYPVPGSAESIFDLVLIPAP